MVAAFGLTLAVMNYSIYQAFARIPLGIAVTMEFLGPLAVAVATSRRLHRPALGRAGRGRGRAAHRGREPGRAAATASTSSGLAFALLAGAAWAAYIILSRATGRRFPGASGLTIAMLVAAVVIVPVGVTAGRGALLRPGILATGLAIGLLSSIIPYTLELEALRRVPARVFGIWMSLEPAVAALVGLVMLGEALAVGEWAAIVCVMVACAGAARGSAAAIPGPGGVKPASRDANRAGRSYHGDVPADPTSPPGDPEAPAPAPGRRPPARRGAWAVPAAGQPPSGTRPGLHAADRAGRGDLHRGHHRDRRGGPAEQVRARLPGLAAVHPQQPGGRAHARRPMFHTWIEFGNRMVTVVVTVVAVAVLIAAWRFRPGGPARAAATWSGWPPRSRPAWWRRSCSAGSWC